MDAPDEERPPHRGRSLRRRATDRRTGGAPDRRERHHGAPPRRGRGAALRAGLSLVGGRRPVRHLPLHAGRALHDGEPGAGRDAGLRVGGRAAGAREHGGAVHQSGPPGAAGGRGVHRGGGRSGSPPRSNGGARTAARSTCCSRAARCGARTARWRGSR
jgi:hypothetical protein